jgi:hypothetical protein
MSTSPLAAPLDAAQADPERARPEAVLHAVFVALKAVDRSWSCRRTCLRRAGAARW